MGGYNPDHERPQLWALKIDNFNDPYFERRELRNREAHVVERTKGFIGRLMGIDFTSYEIKREVNHKMILFFELDGGETAKMEVNFNTLFRNIINSLCSAEQVAGKVIAMEVWGNEYANIIVRLGGPDAERLPWKYEWEKIAGIKDNVTRWIDMYETHLGPQFKELQALLDQRPAKNTRPPVASAEIPTVQGSLDSVDEADPTAAEDDLPF